MAQTRKVNPWTWQDGFGFSQAIDVPQGGRVLYCAGQTSVDVNGAPLHGVQPAGTLLGVASLFHPDILVEIEATAVE